MKFEKWKIYIEQIKNACEKLGIENTKFEIERTETHEEVDELEKKLKHKVPSSLRKVLTEFSASVTISWFLPDDFILPNELKGIFAGECHWSLDSILDSEETRENWKEKVFSNPEDDYDKVWHNKMGFMSVRNGDCIAFDLSSDEADSSVIYLSHDDGEGHGCKLGNNFIDFIDNYLQIGCTGTEDWQMMPFITLSGIDPHGDNATKWRELFGLDIL